MFDRLKQILSDQKDTKDPYQLDIVIEDLTTALIKVRKQHLKISDQETEILTKLESYNQRYHEKLALSKNAFIDKDEFMAENLFKENELLQKQIDQYKNIVTDIQDTKRKLLSQENHFLLTKDKLSSKIILGEANVDVSQLNAEVAEQLMYLNETDELTKFDELIMEATSKFQAIEEIQGAESRIDHYLEKQSTVMEDLQEMVENDRKKKVKASQKNQQLRIEKMFGKMTPTRGKTQKERQQLLLNRLEEKVLPEDRENRIEDFFKQSEANITPRSKTKSNVRDKEDRIKYFFDKSAKPASGSTT